MDEDFSENKIKKDCPHCDLGSFAFKYPLEKLENFIVVCDVHPLTEGHILIIPYKHLSCIGEYTDDLLNEFIKLHSKYSLIIKSIYGSVSSFEHGKLGQTVFHSHVHLLPFTGSPEEIVPEGKGKLRKIKDFTGLRNFYKIEGKYLYFCIGSDNWVVDAGLAAPRFFRDRFAKAIGKPERGNWKEMHANEELMKKAEKEIATFKQKVGSFGF